MDIKLALIDGSLGGEAGNTRAFIQPLLNALRARADVTVISLADVFENSSAPDWEKVLGQQDGFIFATGTYWDSWGSPLQRFLELATEWEAGPLWMGKPAAVVVTMHSVGGKEVLSRLQGVLSTLGCLIPPMSGMTYSLANHLALKGAPSEFHGDLWQPADLEVVAHNLLQSLQGGQDWRPWPVDSGDAHRRWF